MLTILHVDSPCMLETMIMNIIPVESQVLECRAIGHTRNATIVCNICIYVDAFYSSFNRHIVWQVWKLVVAGLDNLNYITCICCGHSLGEGFILRFAYLSNWIRLDDSITISFWITSSRTPTYDITDSGRSWILISIGQILSNGYIFYCIVSNNTSRPPNNTAKVSISLDGQVFNRAVTDSGFWLRLSHNTTNLVTIVVRTINQLWR